MFFLGVWVLALMLSSCAPPPGSTRNASASDTPGAMPLAPISATATVARPTIPTDPNSAAKVVVAASPTATRAAPLPTRLNVPRLTLDVTAPEDESIVTISPIVVTGQTSVGAVVSVNGDLVDVDANGRFRAIVNLEEGPNIIEVNASDVNGNELGTVLTVIYEP